MILDKINMSEEAKKVVPKTDPENAQPGIRCTWETNWRTNCSDYSRKSPDAKIPAAEDVQENVEQVKAVEEQEAGTGMKTTEGYTIDEAGRLDNLPVEPEVYVEEN